MPNVAPTAPGSGCRWWEPSCRRWADRIDIESCLGEGTTVRVELPLGIVQVPPRDGDIDASLPVLIVDDDRINRKVLARCLARIGLDSVYAAGGREGVEVASKQPLALVVMDYEMPDMDGIEATEAIRALHPDLLILGWSASASPEVRRKMICAGARDFLDKPLSARSLRSVLDLYGFAALP